MRPGSIYAALTEPLLPACHDLCSSKLPFSPAQTGWTLLFVHLHEGIPLELPSLGTSPKWGALGLSEAGDAPVHGWYVPQFSGYCNLLMRSVESAELPYCVVVYPYVAHLCFQTSGVWNPCYYSHGTRSDIVLKFLSMVFRPRVKMKIRQYSVFEAQVHP